MKFSRLAGSAGLAFLYSLYLSPSVFADDPITIVVTASRGAETVDESIAPVSIISREEIVSSGATDVAQVLTRVPGLIVSNNGGPGKTTSVFLRGTESDHVLVLVDGVRVGSATLGTTAFQDIPASIVEKIEVVRGPRSSLYGSDAIGGVIQIFTKKGGDGIKPTFSVSAGSNNAYEINAGISAGSDKGWFNANVVDSSTDGINACRGDFSAGCFTVEPDEDGYDNTSFSLRGGAALSENFSLEGGILNSEGENEFDGSFQNEAESKTQAAHVKATLKARDNWDSSLQLSRSQDESENFINGAFASFFDTETTQLSWLNDVLLGSNRVVAGIDYLDDEVDSNNPFAVSNRDNIGYFASFSSTVAETDIEVSLRSDDNEQFGTHTTGGVAVGRYLQNGNRVTASYGTAFKAPTFNELYFPNFGNPNLEEETSSSFDIGVSGGNNRSSWSVNLFQTEIDDLIGFDAVTFLPVNINQAEILGVEVTASTVIAGWAVSAALTLQDPEDTSGGINDGNQLPRRAKSILHIDLNRKIGRWNLGGTLFTQGDSYDDLANLTELDGFTLVNIRSEYLISNRWGIGVHINNIFDEEYETAAFFNQDGINGKVTLRYIPH